MIGIQEGYNSAPVLISKAIATSLFLYASVRAQLKYLFQCKNMSTARSKRPERLFFEDCLFFLLSYAACSFNQRRHAR